MNSYYETEIKVLNVDIKSLCLKLEKLKATKVFDDDRIFTTFDTTSENLMKNKKEIRLTEEGKLKLTYTGYDKDNNKESVKVFVSRKTEMVDFLNRLGYLPKTEVKSHRISYEWDGVDLDIDQFPEIPAFIEIDVAGSKHTNEEIIKLLEIEDKEVVTLSTKGVYKKLGIDYDKRFKI